MDYVLDDLDINVDCGAFIDASSSKPSASELLASLDSKLAAIDNEPVLVSEANRFVLGSVVFRQAISSWGTFDGTKNDIAVKEHLIGAITSVSRKAASTSSKTPTKKNPSKSSAIFASFLLLLLAAYALRTFRLFTSSSSQSITGLCSDTPSR